jgi:hypothetical protein
MGFRFSFDLTCKRGWSFSSGIGKSFVFSVTSVHPHAMQTVAMLASWNEIALPFRLLRLQAPPVLGWLVL